MRGPSSRRGRHVVTCALAMQAGVQLSLPIVVRGWLQVLMLLVDRVQHPLRACSEVSAQWASGGSCG